MGKRYVLTEDELRKYARMEQEYDYHLFDACEEKTADKVRSAIEDFKLAHEQPTCETCCEFDCEKHSCLLDDSYTWEGAYCSEHVKESEADWDL